MRKGERVIRRIHPDRDLNLGFLRTNEAANFAKFRDDLLPNVTEPTSLYTITTDAVMRAINENDRLRMKEISNYFYNASGIYKRILWFFSSIFYFDNMIIPHIKTSNYSKSKLLKSFQRATETVDGLNLKRVLKEITLSIFKDGAYFCYLRDDFPKIGIQQLPYNYCRSKYKVEDRYVVEFNLKYFDKEYRDPQQRLQVLEKFPKEFQKYYKQYKKGVLNQNKVEKEWVLLDVNKATCFKFPDERPYFIGTVKDIINLEQYKDLEYKRDKLALFLLIVQKLPINKDGEMIFDVKEARELHKNAVKMIKNNQEADVLTTFADIEMINLQESKQISRDNLQKAERMVFNETGVSKMAFATEGNLSLAYSIQNSEAIVSYLIEQYSNWLTHIINLIIKSRSQYEFEVWVLPTTVFNAEKMEQKYRQQATLGYSKILPAIVGGMKQSSIVNLLLFENEILDIGSRMIPLQSSYTLSSSDEGGRPSKKIEDKKDTTINKQEAES